MFSMEKQILSPALKIRIDCHKFIKVAQARKPVLPLLYFPHLCLSVFIGG